MSFTREKMAQVLMVRMFAVICSFLSGKFAEKASDLLRLHSESERIEIS